MDNYIFINGQKIELTAEQVEQIRKGATESAVKLAEVPAGETVRIGAHEMVVLEQLGEATVLIRKDTLPEQVQFGKNNNYDGSNVDQSCNEFAFEIAKSVGMENVCTVEVDLTSNDGLKDYGKVERRAASLTAEQYRKYVAVLDRHKPDAWWWLATPHSTVTHGNEDWVKCVSPSGCIHYDRYDYYDNIGVRPFCILKSSIFVSK